MPSGPVTWTIQAQREDYQKGPDGVYGQGIVVTFVTGAGLMGSVFVPNTDYNPERVRQLVTARATAMQSVHQLTGG